MQVACVKASPMETAMPPPATMRAIGLHAAGGAENLFVETVPVPVPRAGEILIEVAAAGVNRPDILQRQGIYPAPKGANPRLGLEVAGIVAALGAGVDNFALGDRVTALLNGGGYAEYACAPQGQVLPVPISCGLVQAAALPETFFTVHENLFRHGHLQPGQTLLVHGGSSGIGTAAIQLAKEFGADVIATAGSEEKCAACINLGAGAAINYKNDDFVVRVKDLTNGRGADVILDMVGGPYLSRNVACLADSGRLVVIAVQGGVRDEKFSILPVMLKRLVITGSTLRPRTDADKARIAAALYARVWPWLAAQKCLPVIDRVFAFEQVAEAHRYLEGGTHIGKIVLKMAAT
jgi:putative PIG3 family NAD(P)H quinone oxidoreductase